MKLLLLLLLLGGPTAAASGTAELPNIVVIMADDLGHADVGFRGTTPIRTPNLDRLAADGVQLDRFYTQPFCSPSRASFLTGALPGDHSYRFASIPAGTPTLTERLRQSGYRTALVGKWHLGEAEEAHPLNKGFDHFYGHLGGYIDYFSKIGPRGHDWQRNGFDDHDREYATTLLGREAVRVIEERDPLVPLFLFLSFNAPHFPPQAPEALIRHYEERTLCRIDFSGRRCRYMAQVDSLDAEIGNVIDALRREGIERETLVLFLSDNGGSTGSKASNLPLRGGKLTTFEGGIRVVALARWPGVISPGSATDQIIRIQDLWGTIETAAGLPRAAPSSSHDLWRALRDGSGVRQPPVYATTRPPECYGCRHGDPASSSLIDGDWKIIEIYRINEQGDVRTGLEEFLLFNLREDPFEQNDLAADEPWRLETMLHSLRRWQWHDERWANEPIQCRPAPRAKGTRWSGQVGL